MPVRMAIHLIGIHSSSHSGLLPAQRSKTHVHLQKSSGSYRPHRRSSTGTQQGQGHRRITGSRSAACDSAMRSEEHTSELQSRPHLVCRLLLEKKKRKKSHCCTELT